MAAFWLAWLGLLLLVLVAVCRSAPKCPRCGSVMARRYDLLPWVRQCIDCHEVYELKP